MLSRGYLDPMRGMGARPGHSGAHLVRFSQLSIFSSIQMPSATTATATIQAVFSNFPSFEGRGCPGPSDSPAFPVMIALALIALIALRYGYIVLYYQSLSYIIQVYIYHRD